MEVVLINKTVKRLLIAAAGLFLIIIGFCGYRIITIVRQYRADQEIYNDLLSRYVSLSYDPEAILTTPAPTQRPGWYDPYDDLDRMSITDASPITVNFSATPEDVSGAVVGHLYCEGTKINYPVMQHSDNDFYLNHDSTGRVSAAGALFVGASNFSDFSDVNTVIHGHHLNNGLMFGAIEKWGSQSWFDSHSTLYLNTPSQNYKLEAVAYYEVSKSSNAFQIEFKSEEAVNDWVTGLIKNAKTSSGYSYYAGDRFVSLATCVYTFKDARGILLCKLVPVA